MSSLVIFFFGDPDSELKISRAQRINIKGYLTVGFFSDSFLLKCNCNNYKSRVTGTYSWKLWHFEMKVPWALCYVTVII